MFPEESLVQVDLSFVGLADPQRLINAEMNSRVLWRSYLVIELSAAAVKAIEDANWVHMKISAVLLVTLIF